MVEIPLERRLRAAGDLADQYGFRITGARVKLLGYCAECQTRVNSEIQ